MEVGQVFCCRPRYARGWGFHLQARVWGSLGARGGGVWDAVVGRVLAMGPRAEVAEQGVVGRCRPGCGGGDAARFCSHGGRNAGTHQAVIRTSDKTTTTWSSGEYGGASVSLGEI